ncbi:hypothetical protein P4571_15360 [Niallia alba]|uniref:hypothetical protein n=1 Tax=Niallia alba TaxID=2729105 RepID=UPI002E233290|nr:hypothetical protein [Niallia alba]
MPRKKKEKIDPVQQKIEKVQQDEWGWDKIHNLSIENLEDMESDIDNFLYEKERKKN